MRNPNYSAAALAETVELARQDAATALSRLSTLTAALEATGAAYDSYAHDHAAETLEHVARALIASGERMRSLEEYTNYPPVRS